MCTHRGVLRSIATGGLALLFALVGMAPAIFASPAASAASSSAEAATASPTIHLAHRLMLNEASIDGPALSSGMDNFEGVHFFTALAWTGTDSLHHVNVIKSTDDPANGVTHFANKLTLGETSFVRPAVVQFGGGLGNTVLAWAGTDSAHTLNFLWDAYGSNPAQHKVTLWGETTNSAPALVNFGNTIVLAWVGTNANHSLNVLPYSMSNQTFGAKTTLPQFSGADGVNLSVYNVTGGAQLALNWTTSASRLNIATSTDGVHFTAGLGSAGMPQTSASAPSSFFHKSDVGERYFIAWTGTDSAHHLNIQWTSSFPQWPDPATTKYILDDTALGGPQIALNDGYLIAWTGTDAGHHLNIAAWDLY